MAAVAEFADLNHRTFSGLPTPLTLRLPVSLSDAELIAFSSRVRPYQVEQNAQGELEIMTPLGGEGGRWESRVIRELDLWAERDGTGVTFSSNTGFRLPDGSMLSPDASWLQNMRWSDLLPEQRQGIPPLAPDFVIEILSKTDLRTALAAKMRKWIENGVRLAWMIDPYQATVEIYSGSHQTTLQRPTEVSAEPLIGFRLATSEIWGMRP